MTLLRFATDLETLAIALEREASVADCRRIAWLIGQICDVYGDADASARVEVRHVLARHPLLRVLFADEMVRAAAALERDPSPWHLRHGLMAAVLADGAPDERTWSARLGGLARTPALPRGVVDTLWDEAGAHTSSATACRVLQEEDRRRRGAPTMSRRAALRPA